MSPLGASPGLTAVPVKYPLPGILSVRQPQFSLEEGVVAEVGRSGRGIRASSAIMSGAKDLGQAGLLCCVGEQARVEALNHAATAAAPYATLITASGRSS